MIAAAKRWSSRLFGANYYDAAVTNRKRKAPPSRIKSTDDMLKAAERRTLVSNSQDLQRNFSVAAWAVRRHLDYVTSFEFQARTGDNALNDRIEELMRWYSRPRNCDVTGRHNLRRMVRMMEERRLIDGDVFAIKLSSGLLQAIESDRIRDPSGGAIAGSGLSLPDARKYKHGVLTTKAGRARRYALHDRTDHGNYRYVRDIDARNIIPLAYYDRFDQIRGISPLAPAVNAYQDLREGISYALAKMKGAQIFGMGIFSANDEEVGKVIEGEDSDSPSDVIIDFGDGPVKLQLDPDDKVEFFESKSPSTEVQTFLQQVTAIALKALDLPFSFYDESFTNFFGSRAALMHYLRSAKSKQEDLQEWLDAVTLYRLGLFIADGTLDADITQIGWEWVPTGVPWWDPSKDIVADIMAVNAGFKTRQKVVRERFGMEFRDVVDQLADEERYMEAAGVPIIRLNNFQPVVEAQSQAEEPEQ